MRQLLFVSSRVKNFTAIQASVHPTVLLLHYKYETCSAQSLIDDVKLLLQGGKVDCIGFILHGTLTSINICGKDDVTLTKDNLASNERIRHFLVTLAELCLQPGSTSRIIWFATSLGQAADGAIFTKHLNTILQVQVDLCRDFSGPELSKEAPPESDSELNSQGGSHVSSCVGELFFKADKLRSLNSSYQQSLAGFEKIRVVGKGAYGTAVLYRKRDDDSLVILKEINLHDLKVSERAMALNEVKVLSMLNHPHIISYYDSFEEEGNMLIEMEYAECGTLSEYLNQLTQPLEERRIIEMFQQIVAAIAYVHEHNILHRDIKAANIFLSSDGTLKVGDFGISKMLSTNLQNANTVLGTPYYISPEMCKGKTYDAKSDIWALGCILYEMACLHRTFDGTNLPALVTKIVNGQFAPIKGSYSEQFKQLVADLLNQDPEKRPSAKVLASERLPKLFTRLKESDRKQGDHTSLSAGSRRGSSSQISSKASSASNKRIRSVLYYLELNSFILCPVYLPPKTRIQEVAVGPNHVVVLTLDMMVFSWGEGTKGQLGHGDWETRYQPSLVETLKDKSIVHVCCGSNFTIFSSANGIVMTCGDGSKGCLGHGDFTSLNKPRLIEALLSVDASSVACGPEHVVVILSGGLAYAWGQGGQGRLGYGSEESFSSPQRISFPEKFTVRQVRCGTDCTMFITDLGVVLATGSNHYNKIGLNNRQGFLMAMKHIFTKTEVDGVFVPTVVKSLSQYRIVDAALGPTHTVLLSDSGQVITIGRNSYAQLGLGNRREQRRPTVVSKLKAPASYVGSSARFSVAGSKTSNAVYFWGARRHPGNGHRGRRSRRFHSRSSLNRRASSNASTKSGESLSDDDSLDSVYCSSSDLDDDMDSLRPLSAAGSHERLQGGTGSAGSERRQSSSGSNRQQSISLQNSSSKVQPAQPAPLIGAHRSFSAEGLSATASEKPVPLPASASEATKDRTRQRLQSVGSPGVPVNSTSSAGGIEDDEELQIIPWPTHILRLQSTGSDEKREVLELSGLHSHGNNLFVHVETTAPPPNRSQAPKPTKEAFKSPKDAALPLYNTPSSTSVPTSAEGSTMVARNPNILRSSDDVPDWLQREIDDATESDQPKPSDGTMSIGSSRGGSGVDQSRLHNTSGGAVTDDDDMSSVAVADDELDDEAGSVALTTTDADENDQPLLKIKINSQLARGSHSTGHHYQTSKPLAANASSKLQSKTSGRKITSRSGIPPSGTTKSHQPNTPRRTHHKSLSISGSVSSLSPNNFHRQNSTSSTSASSQRPPLKLPHSMTPTQSSGTRTRNDSTSSNFMSPMTETGSTFGIGGGDSSPSSSVATTRVEVLVRELEERYRAEREQIRREAEELSREREKALRDEIEILKSQLALQQMLPDSTKSLPVSSPETSNSTDGAAGKMLQTQNSVKSDTSSSLTDRKVDNKPASKVCVLS